MKNKGVTLTGDKLKTPSSDFKLDQNQKRRLAKAIDNLRATEIGRHLLERGEALGYSLVYKQKLKNFASCHNKPKIIEIRADLKIETLSIILAHELAHAIQFHDHKMPKVNKHPNLLVMRSLAMEADASAHTALFALEYAFAARNETQYKHILRQLGDLTPRVAKACIEKVVKAGRLDEHTKRDIMRTAFETYYNEAETRSTYDVKAITDYDWEGIDSDDIKYFKLSKSFNRAARELQSKFRFNGHPYLDKTGGHRNISLNSARYMGMTSKAFKKAQELIDGETLENWVTNYRPLNTDNYPKPASFDEVLFSQLKKVIKNHKEHIKQNALLLV